MGTTNGHAVKYWGQNTLKKISSLVGSPIKTESATKSRERMAFFRVLVEVPINEEYPKEAKFENKVGKIIKQQVVYE